MNWKTHFDAENLFSASCKKEGGYLNIESQRRIKLWQNAVKLANKKNPVFEQKTEFTHWSTQALKKIEGAK